MEDWLRAKQELVHHYGKCEAEKNTGRLEMTSIKRKDNL
jgi:hypothetical protein